MAALLSPPRLPSSGENLQASQQHLQKPHEIESDTVMDSNGKPIFDLPDKQPASGMIDQPITKESISALTEVRSVTETLTVAVGRPESPSIVENMKAFPPNNPQRPTVVQQMDLVVATMENSLNPITALSLENRNSVLLNRSMKEEIARETKVKGSENGKQRGQSPMMSWSGKRENVLEKAELGTRICAAAFSLVSFSVMASDKTPGWSGDSFDRYIEYRYSISVTAIAFAYSGFQIYGRAHRFLFGKYIFRLPTRFFFDFFMDQVLAYLLMSASSCAATQADDWQSNWGKDEFTIRVNASAGMSFLAFGALAISSLISGHHLCNLYSYPK